MNGPSSTWQAPGLDRVVEHHGAPLVLVDERDDLHQRLVATALVATTMDALLAAPTGSLIIAEAELLGAADLADALSRLEQVDAAALILYLPDAADLSPQLHEVIRGRSVPVFVTEGTSFVEVVGASLEAVIGAQRERVERVLEIHQRFSRIMLSGGGTRSLLMTLHELIGHPVAVVDTEGRLTTVIPPDADPAADPGLDACHRLVIRAGDLTYGNLLVAARVEDLDLDGQVAIERAAMGIAAHFAQASAVAEAHERFAALSLEQLISGHASSVEEVLERAASFGWELGTPRAVLLASIDPPTPVETVEGALSTIAAAARATLGPGAIVWRRSATIAALIDPPDESPAARRDLAESLRQELDQRLRSVTVSIGVGRRVATPDQLTQSFVEASRAVDVGRWAKGRHVTEIFDQLGLERLLASTPPEDLSDYVDQTIGLLIRHDQDHESDLVESLAVWLEVRNVAAAARRLHVHYNTMKNRLDRIESIIGTVLDNAAHVLECEVAVYIQRHHLTATT